MHKPTNNPITIAGLVCYLPEQPKEKILFHNSHLPKKKQKWVRTELPDVAVRDIMIYSGEAYASNEIIDWDAARREEIIGQTGKDPWSLDRHGNPRRIEGILPNPTFVFETLEDFRKQELARCHPLTGGIWIMVNGAKIWVTPFHYFYLNWWKMNTGYPEWRWIDAQRFYHWQKVYEDEMALGEIEASKRGDGKTYRATAKAYLISIYKKNGHIGIQSKTDDDAVEVFQVKMVEPYKDLPDFLVPVNANPTDPKKELRWFAATRQGQSAAAARILQKQALRTKITYRNSKENAYDGSTLAALIRDEEGKGDGINVNQRHSITRDAVYRDGKVVGKIISTTTVEEWDKGGENFKKLWDDSNPNEINELKETKSGLYKMMFPAYQTEYQDEYGYPDEVKAKRVQSARRKALRNNPEALQKYILQYPWNEAEMFTANGINCQFNLNVLRDCERMVNQPGYNGVRIGDFEFTSGVGSKVKWVDNPDNGKWHVSMFLDDDKANNIKKVWRNGGDKFMPSNDHAFAAGFDPTKVRANVKKARSRAAGCIVGKEEFWGENDFPDVVADYVWLPEDPDEAYLDFLAGCMYYGIGFLPESNLGIPSLFERHRSEHFLMSRPEITRTAKQQAYMDEAGMPSGEMTNDILMRRAKTWMSHNGQKLKHPRVIRDLISYDPTERGLYDLGVAFQLAVVAADKWVKKEPVATDLGEMFGNWASL